MIGYSSTAAVPPPLPTFTIHIKSSSMQQISQLRRKKGEKLWLRVHFVPAPKGGAVAFTVKGAALWRTPFIKEEKP